MILTALDIIVASMKLVNAIAIDEAPTLSEQATCLQVLNIMIDSWSASNLMIRSTTLDQLALVPKKFQYTIGIGGDFNTTKPISISTAFLRDATNIDTPFAMLNQMEYNSLVDKDIAVTRPDSLYYDPGFTQSATPSSGTIYLYPIPDASSVYTLFLESFKYLTEFTSVTDTVTFEPAYYEALVYNLAMRIFRMFHSSAVAVPNDIVVMARESKRIVERMNSTMVTAGFDLPGKASVYNIYTDQSR